MLQLMLEKNYFQIMLDEGLISSNWLLCVGTDTVADIGPVGSLWCYVPFGIKW